MMASDGGLQKGNVVLHRKAGKITLPPRNKEAKMEAEVCKLQVQRPRTLYWRCFLFLSVNKAPPPQSFRFLEMTRHLISHIIIAFFAFCLFSCGGWMKAPRRRTSQPSFSHRGQIQQNLETFGSKCTEIQERVEDG